MSLSGYREDTVLLINICRHRPSRPIQLILVAVLPALLVSPLLAQGTLALSPATSLSNGVATSYLTLTSPFGSEPAGLQWTLTYPPTSVVSINAVAGASSIAAGTTLSCAAIPGSYTCVLAGPHGTVMQNGVVAVVGVAIAPGVASMAISVTNTLGASASANSLPVIGVGATITAPVAVSGLSCLPAPLNTGASSTCTVSLNAPAPVGGAAVTLSSNSAALTAPAVVTVGAGSTTATFTATAGTIASNQTATITATLNGSTQAATISLVAPVLLTGLTCTPTSLGAGVSATCTVSVSSIGGAAVTLSSNALALTVPASAAVGSTNTTATFTATASTTASNQTATIAATLNGSRQTATISLVAIVSVALTPTSATAQNAGTLQFTAAVNGSSNSGVTWLLSPLIGSISSSGFYTAPQFVNSPQAVTVTATSMADPSQSASASILLQPVGLVGYWPFDESSGFIANDASGSGNNGTLQCLGGCAPLPNWTSGIRNGAINFSVTNDFVSVPDQPNLELTNQFTIALWTNPAGPGNEFIDKVSGVSVAKGSGASNGYRFGTNTAGSLFMSLYKNSTLSVQCLTATGVEQLQTWQHYAISYDSKNIRIYVNSVLRTTCATTSQPGTDGTPLSIGGIRNDPTSARMMDEVRLYNRALSAQEIASIYNDPGLPTGSFAPGAIAAVSAYTVGCSPDSLSEGILLCNVRLAQGAPPHGTAVFLQSNSPRLQLPSQLLIPEGNQSGDVSAKVFPSDQDEQTQIRAVIQGAEATTSVMIGGIRPTALSCPAGPIQAGSWFSCEVELNSSNIPGVATLIVFSGDPGLKIPALLMTRPGQTRLTFSVYAAPRATAGSSNLTVQFGESAVSTAVFVTPASGPSLNTPADMSAVFDKPVSFTVSATDPADFPVVLSASGLPPGATFNPGSGVFSWTPARSQQGIFPIRLMATNSANAVSTRKTTIAVDSGMPVITDIQNAASKALPACSPGSVASLIGRWLVSSGIGASNPSGTLNELAGTRVKVNGEYVSVVGASATRVDFVCPRTDPGTVLTVFAETGAGIAGPVSTTMYPTSPGLYSLDGAGTGQGLVTLAGTSLLAEARDYLGLGRPAEPGDSITIRATGIGTGDAALPIVTIGDIYAEVLSVQAAAGVIGVYEITAKVPFGVQESNTVSVGVMMPPDPSLFTHSTRSMAGVTAAGGQSNRITIAVEQPHR